MVIKISTNEPYSMLWIYPVVSSQCVRPQIHFQRQALKGILPDVSLIPFDLELRGKYYCRPLRLLGRAVECNSNIGLKLNTRTARCGVLCRCDRLHCS